MGLDALGIGSIASLIQTGIDKIWPDPAQAAAAKTAVIAAEQAGSLKELDAQLQTNLEQIKANAVEEAKPGITFRDGAGWVCVVGFAIIVLKAPIEWGCVLVGHPVTLPTPDVSLTTDTLLALLGIGGMHLYEQVKTS